MPRRRLVSLRAGFGIGLKHDRNYLPMWKEKRIPLLSAKDCSIQGEGASLTIFLHRKEISTREKQMIRTTYFADPKIIITTTTRTFDPFDGFWQKHFFISILRLLLIVLTSHPWTVCYCKHEKCLFVVGNDGEVTVKTVTN